MKIRRGGVLTPEFEQRVLDGDVRAMRPLLRQAQGVNVLDCTQRAGVTVPEIEVRAVANGTGGTRLAFQGYASVTESPFVITDWLGSYDEIVHQGAFAKTLAEAADVIFCFNHDWNPVPMARTTTAGTLRLAEDSTGLLTNADIDGQRADVYALQSAIDAGEITAMSFAFWATRQTWSPDYDQRDILEVDMDGGDTSAVTWPANPATTGSVSLTGADALSRTRTEALSRAQARCLLRTNVPRLIVDRARAEKRIGATLSAATLEVLQEVLDLVAEADVAVDAAQPLLAELMGVPNPDDEDSAAGATDTDDDTSSESKTESAPPTGMALSLMRLREDPAVRRSA